MGAFTPWELANIANQGFISFFLHDLKWRALFGSVDLGAIWPRFKPQLCYLVAVRSLAPDFSALNVTFLLCEVSAVAAAPPRALQRSNEMVCVEC